MKFEKLHCLGNDFIVVDVRKKKFAGEDMLPLMAKKLCDRHFGVGADGLILMMDSLSADLKMRVFNSDGSESETSCSGACCFAAYAYNHGIMMKSRFSLETTGGTITPELGITDGVLSDITVDLGCPKFRRSEIPMAGADAEFVSESFMADGHPFDISAVRLGVPHLCVFVPEITDSLVKNSGRLLESARQFPRRINVDFVRVIDENSIEVRSYERGVGPVLASGTGVCAAAVTSAMRKLTARQVEVRLVGGSCHVDWTDSGRVLLSVRAQSVFEGKISKKSLLASIKDAEKISSEE